jgi:hypothetical protein
MVICLACNFGLAFLAALWDSAPGIVLRTGMAALGAFQLDRLLWIAPCFWMLLFACGIALAGLLLQNARRAAIPAVLLAALAAIYMGGALLCNSDVKSNIQKLRDPEYGMMSISDYYALGVMDQVEEYLKSERGQSMEDYRVASLGIDPAAALYHGFYCLDGYSNNYSLEYKHAFRRIIAPELDKSEYLTTYFDDWGNRCYLFSSECPGYYTIEKNGFYFSDYELDTEAFCELGGDYILSAAYIANAEEQGLSLVREEPFETQESYYRIFLYEVNADD